MSRNTKIINMSLPNNIYQKMSKLAQERKISKSELLRQALKEYVVSEQRWQEIKKWGKETANNLKIQDEKSIEKLIYEFRKSSA